ncbi:MAG: peptide/nickel transport system permease protein [Actinomycetota bacterium]|nr:peptide/nickel transport system permease protein [Actinomycetota bacterium]
MLRFIVGRVLWAIPVMVIASILVFVVVRMSVDPVAAAARNPKTTPAALKKFEHDLGLDKSGPEQYWTWFKGFVRGDWGRSQHSDTPVFPEIRTALANSLVLGLFASFIAISVGVIIGIISALKQYSWFDNLSTGGAFLGLSLPPFVFGLILQIVFGTFLVTRLHRSSPVLPIAGMQTPGTSGFHLADRFSHLILPALTIAVQVIATYSRYMRTSMLETLNSDYLRTARAKGISERRVIVRHAFRNALIPLTTFVAIDIGAIAGGLVITEKIFEYPGMGQYFLNGFHNGDYTEILPWLMIVVGAVILFNLLADLSYAWLDPRIRLD